MRSSGFQKKSFENFKPRLKPGTVIPHGHQIIFETKDGSKKIILPMELADLILLASGKYTLREIMEKMLRRKGSLHFKTLFRAVHQLRAYGFLTNGDQLEAFNPFGKFDALSWNGPEKKWRLWSSEKVGRSRPLVFYSLSVAILVLVVWGWVQVPWPYLNAEVLGETPSLQGFAAFLLSFSFLASMQSLVRMLQQKLLLGQSCGLYLKINLWSFYLKAGDEPVYSIRNRLFLLLYHSSIAFSPLAISSWLSQLDFSAVYLDALIGASFLKVIFDLSPFSGSEAVRATRNFFSLSDSDLIAGCIRDKSILNLLSPEHENRSRRLRDSFSVYVWAWSSSALYLGALWLKSLGELQDSDSKVIMGLLWVGVIIGMMVIFQRLLYHFFSYLHKGGMVIYLGFKGWIQTFGKNEWTMPKVQEILSELPLFSYFSPSLLEKLLRSSVIMPVRSGTKVITQGEIGRHLYVLLEGGMLIESTTQNRQRMRLSRLLPISIFGEMAIFEDTTRTADVVASEFSVVLKVSAHELRKAAEESQYMREIEAFKNAILVNQFFASAPMFRELSNQLVENIVNRSTMKFFAAGDTIFNEGDPGHSLFMLIRGSVEVSIDEKPVKIIRQGGFFGEIAVVADVPRTATVKAIGSVVVLEIATTSLWEVLSQDIELAMFIETVGESRLREDLERHQSKILKPTGS